MANHGATVLLLIASIVVVVAVSSTDARLTAVRHNARVVTVPRDALGGYSLEKEKAAPPVPELTCKKVHGVRAGETCSSVAKGSGLTQYGFLSFNPNINCDHMFVGQWVCLRATTA